MERLEEAATRRADIAWGLFPLLALAGACAAGRTEPAQPEPACSEGAVTTPCTCGIPGNVARALPASLFSGQKPGWWPDGIPWPWAGSDLAPMVGTLPAKARSDAMP